MRVLVDDVETELGSMPLHEAVNQAASTARACGRIVVEVEIDGRACAGEALDAAMSGGLPETPGLVRLTTADLIEQACTVLAEAGRELANADVLQCRAAELIEASDPVAGMSSLSEALGIWSRVEQSITLVTRLIEIPLDRVTVEGVSADRVIADLGTRLRQMAEALATQDPIGLSDTLLYDMPEVTQQWRDLLAEVERTVREEKGR